MVSYFNFGFHMFIANIQKCYTDFAFVCVLILNSATLLNSFISSGFFMSSENRDNCINFFAIYMLLIYLLWCTC